MTGFSSVRCACALAIALVVGCAASPVKKREMAEDPIAFVYHAEELARRRAEALGSGNARPRDNSRSAIENRGVLNLNDFGDYLGNAFKGTAAEKYRGRLALLDPRSKDVEVIDGPQRGAIPQAWSPDRRRLLFAQGDPGMLQLFEYDRDTKEVAPRTHGPDPHPQGCYASDGRLVVSLHRKEAVAQWGGQRYLTSRLAIQSPTGTTEPITSGPVDGDPACSPDGRTVAFVRAIGRGTQIWIQELTKGAPARPITVGRDPSFSPDGRWLVFSRNDSGKPTLWRIRVDGVGRTRMGLGAGTDEYRPSVSPDGSVVVYESVLGNRYRLFMRRFDGSGDVVLFASGDGTHAVW